MRALIGELAGTRPHRARVVARPQRARAGLRLAGADRHRALALPGADPGPARRRQRRSGRGAPAVRRPRRAARAAPRPRGSTVRGARRAPRRRHRRRRRRPTSPPRSTGPRSTPGSCWSSSARCARRSRTATSRWCKEVPDDPDHPCRAAAHAASPPARGDGRGRRCSSPSSPRSPCSPRRSGVGRPPSTRRHDARGAGRPRRRHRGVRRRRLVRRLLRVRHVHRADRHRVLGRHVPGAAAARSAPPAGHRRQAARHPGGGRRRSWRSSRCSRSSPR